MKYKAKPIQTYTCNKMNGWSWSLRATQSSRLTERIKKRNRREGVGVCVAGGGGGGGRSRISGDSRILVTGQSMLWYMLTYARLKERERGREGGRERQTDRDRERNKRRRHKLERHILGSEDSSVVRASDSWSKGPGFESGRSGGKLVLSRINIACRLLFRYPFHPRVTAVARKRSRPFCQKCTWQVTVKHTHTLTYVALHEVTL